MNLLDLDAAWRSLRPEEQQVLGMAAIANEIAFVANNRTSERQATYDAMEVVETEATQIITEIVDELFPEPQEAVPDLSVFGIRQCTGCGCADQHACEQGCSWAGPRLCSACAKKDAAK